MALSNLPSITDTSFSQTTASAHSKLVGSFLSYLKSLGLGPDSLPYEELLQHLQTFTATTMARNTEAASSTAPVPSSSVVDALFSSSGIKLLLCSVVLPVLVMLVLHFREDTYQHGLQAEKYIQAQLCQSCNQVTDYFQANIRPFYIHIKEHFQQETWPLILHIRGCIRERIRATIFPNQQWNECTERNKLLAIGYHQVSDENTQYEGPQQDKSTFEDDRCGFPASELDLPWGLLDDMDEAQPLFGTDSSCGPADKIREKPAVHYLQFRDIVKDNASLRAHSVEENSGGDDNESTMSKLKSEHISSSNEQEEEPKSILEQDTGV